MGVRIPPPRGRRMGQHVCPCDRPARRRRTSHAATPPASGRPARSRGPHRAPPPPGRLAVRPARRFADQPALTQARLPDHTDQLASIRGEGLVQRSDPLRDSRTPSLRPRITLRVSTERSCPRRFGLVGPLMATCSTAPSRAAPSTSRAVCSEHMTTPAGAADSMRCAIPTGCPTAVYVCPHPSRSLPGDDVTGIEPNPQEC